MGGRPTHHLPAQLDQAHAILEREHTRHAERRVLPEGEAGHRLAAGDRLLPLATELLQSRHPCEEHGRLANVRLLKTVLWATQADLDDVEAHNRICRLDELLHRW